MRLYDLPLHTRLRKAELKRQRYLDPEQRLRAINRARRRFGYPPAACLSECKLRIVGDEA